MRMMIAAFLTLCFGLAVTGLSATGAMAAPQSVPAQSIQEQSAQTNPLIRVAQPFCAQRHDLCRARWGANWRFRRCMKAAACWAPYLRYRAATAAAIHSCGGWREACAKNWGFRTNDYFGCLKYHGCR